MERILGNGVYGEHLSRVQVEELEAIYAHEFLKTMPELWGNFEKYVREQLREACEG